ncbi:MAG: hypothetical protein M1838_000121 [Thelocarpon superellum]|nr:MAG: hypothetical protein M1838_000121 [Thelocarpon superellum]
MVSWSTLQTLLFTLAPLLLPRLISYYRSMRSSAASTAGISVQRAPVSAKRAFNVLFVSAALALVSTLPYFQPPNIFLQTQSRIQIPTDVLFTRLSALHPLSATEEALQQKLVSFEARLLYFTYGPDPLAHCRFCNSDDITSYLYYALPSILIPHLVHLVFLGLATSTLICGGREPAKWRTVATCSSIFLALMEIYCVGSHNHKLNTAAQRVGDIDFFHWDVLTYRGLSIAVTDAVLAGLIYLSSTNRMFVTPLTTAERLEVSTRMLEAANSKLHAAGVTRNAIFRDETLRRKTAAYWDVEGRVTRELFEEREVVEGIRAALGRVDVASIGLEAGRFADTLVGGVQLAPRPEAQAQAQTQAQVQAPGQVPGGGTKEGDVAAP